MVHLPTPPQLFELFDAGRLTRTELHAALGLHAAGLLGELAENRRHPAHAELERQLGARAAAQLAHRHGEPEVREIFRALAEVADFPPAQHLWNAGHADVPLHCFLRIGIDPVFRVLRLDATRLAATIAVEHGQARGKSLVREEFQLRRGAAGQLVVTGRRPVAH